MLEARFPELAIEVLPMACAETDSYCMYQAAKAAVALEPDFFVLYMGNNEVTGQWGVMNFFARRLRSDVRMVRLWKAFQTLRIVQTIGDMGRRFYLAVTGREGPAPEAIFNSLTMYSPQDRVVQDCYKRFGANVRDICDVGISCGAQVVICTVASNLRDWPPFASRHPGQWGPQEREAWSQTIERGMSTEKEGHFEKAVQYYESALTLDSMYAETHYRLGHCYLNIGDTERARESFVKARDHDRVQVRANTAINKVLCQTVGEYAGHDVILVDSASAIAAASKDGIPGWDVFYDCVHFQFIGNYLLAKSVYTALCEKISALNAGIPEACSVMTFEEAEKRLVLTPEILLEHLKTIEDSILTGINRVFNKEYHVAQVRESRQFLERRAIELGEDHTRDTYLNALTLFPGDNILRASYVRYLLKKGDAATALTQAQQLCIGKPLLKEALKLLGMAQYAAHRYAEACETLEQTISRYPDDWEAWTVIAAAYKAVNDERRAEYAEKQARRLQQQLTYTSGN